MKYHYRLAAFLICMLVSTQYVMQGFAQETAASISTNPLYTSAAETDAFDIVFVMDTGAYMNNYDFDTDKGWLDAYVGLMEQAPEGSRFGVVTGADLCTLGDAQQAQEKLFQMPPYVGTPAYSDLLSAGEAALGEDSSRRKMLVFTTASCYNYSTTSGLLDALREKGIAVAWIALETDTASAALAKQYDDSVIICRSVQEIGFNMSDLYAALVDFKNRPQTGTRAAALSSNNVVRYDSAYRAEKHSYSFSVSTNLGGVYFSELLNMYYHLPAYTQAYNLLSLAGATSCKALGKGNSSEVSFQSTDGRDAFLGFWNDKATAIFNSEESYLKRSTSGLIQLQSTIRNNLRKRIPVLVRHNSTFYLVTGWSETGAAVSLETANGVQLNPAEITGTVEVLDSAAYFLAIKVNGFYLESSHLSNEDAKLKITLPADYAEGSVALALTEGTGTPWASFAAGCVKIGADMDAKLTANIKVDFSGYLPNCYNATQNFVIKIYPDVDPSAWYTRYIFDMSNREIVMGHDTGLFDPEDPVTLDQFLVMTLRAVEIAQPNGDDTNPDLNTYPYNQVNIDSIWAVPNLKLAYQKNWITATQVINSHLAIPREEAADIIWKVFMSDDCRIVHQLFNYQRNAQTALNQRVLDWNNNKFPDQGQIAPEYENAMFQLYMNAVFEGSPQPDGSIPILPKNSIKRGEMCKVLSSCLYSVEDSQVINNPEPDYIIDDFPILTVGMPATGSTNEANGQTYRCTIPSTGLYQLTLDNGIEAMLYGANQQRILEKGGYPAMTYHIEGGQEILVSLSGASSQSYTITLSQIEAEPEKTVYFVLYDSAIAKFGETAQGVSRYRDANDNDYNYTPAFFERYLTLTGDQKVAFILSVRDADFDSDVTGHNLYDYKYLPDIDETRQNNVIDAVSEKMVNVINHMKDGLALANTDRTNKIAMPDIYLGTPHTYHGTVEAADGADAENELIRKYRHVSEEIYNNVSREVGKDIVTGIYYGREDPDPMRDESGNLSTSYKNMQSISQFAHEKGLKLFWSPYCINDTHWNQIGEIVNTGSFIGQDGRLHDVFDKVMIQPGLFYSAFNGDLNNLPAKVINLYASTQAQTMLDGSNVIGTEKLTDTLITFEMEYDISLVTGRMHGADDNVEVFPSRKADNFVRTYKYFKDLIQNPSVSYGIYAGGPNELDYGKAAWTGDNTNRHNLINHPSVFGTYVRDAADRKIWSDPRDGDAYNTFYNTINNSIETGDSTPYYATYNDALLYDITNGILNQIWTPAVKQFLNVTTDADFN